MDKQEIKQLAIELMDAVCARQVAELDLTWEGMHIAIKKSNMVASAPANTVAMSEVQTAIEIPTEEVQGTKVEAPLVGIFYSAPSPNDPPFVEVGQKVQAGDTLFIIEAMKTMNEIVAPCDGVVSRMYAQNGDMVEYHQLICVIA